MHYDVLNSKQSELLNLIKAFKREYYLVGGTAIALHIGHRQSIDFDLFKPTGIHKKKIFQPLKKTIITINYGSTANLVEECNFRGWILQKIFSICC
jgi:hypothetical protein